MSRRLGRLAGALWLVLTVVFFFACACIFIPHLISLALGGLLLARPTNRIALGLSFAACVYLVALGIASLVLSRVTPTPAMLAIALVTIVSAIVVAVLSLLAIRRPDRGRPGSPN